MKRLLFNNSSIVLSFIFLVFTSITSCTSSNKKIIVSKKGKYKTIQSAIDKVVFNNKKQTTIFVKKGIYNEQLTIDTRKNNILLLGEDRLNTIISFNNHAGKKQPNGDTFNTWNCATVFVYANDLTAKNITFKNDAGFTAGQAVATRIDGDRCAFYNCSFIGNQDVLFLQASGTRQYFKNCYIEGTTDFIFGASTAIFDSCHLHSKKNSHITAASTNSIVPFGFVFRNCKLTADSHINKVSLGRPWSPHASVTYVNCFMDKHIIAEGWNNWKNELNEKTARYSEYNSFGAGANKLKRALWSKQLTDEQANKYTFENIFITWLPN